MAHNHLYIIFDIMNNKLSGDPPENTQIKNTYFKTSEIKKSV